MGPNESKRVHVCAIKSNWVQFGLNGSGWVQMGPNGSKWVQICPNMSKCIKQGEKFKQVQTDQNGWKLSKWPEIAQHGLKWLKLGLNCQKFIKKVQNGPILYDIIKYGIICSKFILQNQTNGSVITRSPGLVWNNMQLYAAISLYLYFPLHNFQKWVCRCQWAYSFGIGEDWIMIQTPMSSKKNSKISWWKQYSPKYFFFQWNSLVYLLKLSLFQP